MIQLKNSFNLYLKRDTLDYCIEIVDNVLQQKKCRITSKNRRNIYYALHDIKIEKHDNDNILSIDKNRIEILLKIVSYN
jgi:alanyl-tRNA synthetase